MTDFVKNVLTRAVSQEGVKENRNAAGQANNTGKSVEMYQRAVGIPPGSAWCAAFVYWAIAEEAALRKIEPPMLRSGYCPAIDAWAKAAGILRDKPEVGDFFLVMRDYPEGRFASHIGLVTAVHADTFETIEGNTNAGLSNEGDGVYRRTRKINGNCKFGRWARLLPQPVTEPPTFTLIINGRKVCAMPVVGGRSLVPLRAWADYWRQTIAWDADTQTVELSGEPVPAPVSLINGASYAPLNDMIQGKSLKATVDSKARTVTLVG